MHDSMYMTFQTRHNHGDIKEWCIPGLASDVGLNRQSADEF